MTHTSEAFAKDSSNRALVKVIEKLEKQLANAQIKVAEIQAHIAALKRV